MNPFGSYNPANYSDINPLNVDTGLPWAYIRVINNSPYMLTVTFGGMGSVVFPEMFLEDVPITQSYNGKITIVPFANFPAGSIASALSTLVSINAYQPGELRQPQAQPLTTLAAVGNPVPLSASTDSVINDGNANGTTVVEATPSGGSQALLIDNNGNIKAHSLDLEQPPATGDFLVMFLGPNAQPGWEWHFEAATGNLYLKESVSGKILLYFNSATGGTQTDNGIIITDGAGHTTNTATAGAGANPLLTLAPSDDASLRMSWRMTGNELLLRDDSSTQRVISFFMGLGGVRISGLGNRMAAWSFFSGNASGTYSHGLGTTPNVVLVNASAVGSESIGWDSPTSTTVHITNGDGVAWTALALSMA